MKYNISKYLNSFASFSNINQMLIVLQQGDIKILDDIIKQLKAVLVSQQSPISHIFAIKFIRQMFMLCKQQIITKIQSQLLKQIQKVALYNPIGNKNISRTYFNLYQQYTKANLQEKEQIEKLSIQYVGCCIQSLKAWAEWVPIDSEGNESIFQNTLKNLKKKNIQFDIKKNLYDDISKKKFEKLFRRQFMTQSSNQESILNEQNFQSVIHQQLLQCDQIKKILKVQLNKNQGQTNWKKIKHSIQRAAIFYHQQSKYFIQQLKFILNQKPIEKQNIELNLQIIFQKQQYFGKLLTDYNDYLQKKMTYEQFFDRYQKNNFINQQNNKQKINPSLFLSTKNFVSDINKDSKKSHYMELRKSNSFITQDLTNQVKQQEIQLQEKIQNGNNSLSKRIQLQDISEEESLNEELKIQNENNQLIIIQLKKQIKSYISQIKNQKRQMKKLQKQVNNLSDQRDIIKLQLNTDRMKLNKQHEFQISQIREQNNKLKIKLGQKEKTEKQYLNKLNYLQIIKIELEQKLKIRNNLIQSLEKQNQLLKKKNLNQSPLFHSQKKFEDSNKKKIEPYPKQENSFSVKQYFQDNIEGNTYYQSLTKQFKIRYRRSCLKKKQLLFKQNLLQVGVVSQVKNNNVMAIAAFLTNYGQKTIKDIKLKILNLSLNRIDSSINQIDLILAGQQQKVYIDVTVKSYPIGPVILKINYMVQQLQKVSQILLPVNIFKFISHKNRQSQLDEYGVIKFKYENKIIKNNESIKELFENIIFNQSAQILKGKGTFIHNHSNTTFNLDIIKYDESIEFKYKIVQGWNQISDYFIKNLRNLLER